MAGSPRFGHEADLRQGEPEFQLRVSRNGDTRHQVWLLDAASAYNEIAFLNKAGLNSVALWRLGSEDPGVWTIFGRDHRKLPIPDAIDNIPVGTNVDIEGAGEIS